MRQANFNNNSPVFSIPNEMEAESLTRATFEASATLDSKTKSVFSLMPISKELKHIINNRALTPLYQPIVDLHHHQVIAHEALIRGPADSDFYNPLRLFEAAEEQGCLFEMDWLARSIAIEEFQRQKADNLLFINVTVNSLVSQTYREGMTLECLAHSGLSIDRVVIEITELEPVEDFNVFITSINHYRKMGFKVALDDLGAGYNGLRLWSELRPDFVKIDKHFISGIAHDTEKKHFLQTIKILANGLNTQLIAEGIENEEDLEVIQQLDIDFAQGYLFRRPESHISSKINFTWPAKNIAKPLPQDCDLSSLLLKIEPVEPHSSVDKIANELLNKNSLDFLPVVKAGKVKGMVWRRALMDKLARRFGQELHHRKPVEHIMDPNPIIVDISTPVEELSRMITDGQTNHNAEAFIITHQQRYVGCGRFIDLLRLITDLKIKNAQYANPLSGLPGNVPIQRQMKTMLEARQGFSVIYVDADHFKPYNDFYSYEQGDEIIRQLSTLLQQTCHPKRDFIGHIGGDDFMVISSKTDCYEEICRSIIDKFNLLIKQFYHPKDQSQGGILSYNREGKAVFFPIMTLSLGVLVVPPGLVAHQQKIAGLATKAKKQAKVNGGNGWAVIEVKNEDQIRALS